MLSDEWLSRYGLLENFNASVTRTGTGTHTGTGTWTTGVTAIALCTSCSRAKKGTSRQRSGKGAIRKNPTPKTEVGKKQTNNQVLYTMKHRKLNEQLFSQ